MNSRYLEDDFVQTEQDQGAPTLEGASDGSGSIFSQLFSSAVDLGGSALRRYTDPPRANARATAPPISLRAEDSNRFTLWAIVAGVVLIAVVLFASRKG
jgi:hypothetical protein